MTISREKFYQITNIWRKIYNDGIISSYYDSELAEKQFFERFGVHPKQTKLLEDAITNTIAIGFFVDVDGSTYVITKAETRAWVIYGTNENRHYIAHTNSKGVEKFLSGEKDYLNKYLREEFDKIKEDMKDLDND